MANGTSDNELLIMAVTKGVVCVLLVGIVGYAVVAEVPVDGGLLDAALLLLASYFGLSAKGYYAASRGGRGGRGRG